MEKVEGILAVHEFHVWQLAGDRIIASAHIRCLNLAEYMEVSDLFFSISVSDLHLFYADLDAV